MPYNSRQSNYYKKQRRRSGYSRGIGPSGLIVIVLVVLMLVAGSVVLYAYFNKQQAQEKTKPISTQDVSLNDSAPKAKLPSDGSAVKRHVDITNNGKARVVIRVGYNEYMQKVNGESFVCGDAVEKTWAENWDNSKFWTFNQGFYYYNYVLDSNEKVDILESLAYNENITEQEHSQYDDSEYNLEFVYDFVYADAAQIEEEWVQWGVGVKITDNSVKWSFSDSSRIQQEIAEEE